MEINKPKIVIVDDHLNDDEPLITELQEIYNDVELVKTSSKVPKVISKNLNQRIIVVLDIKLSPSEPDGHVVLKKIREMSNLIPVIIWSAVDEKSEEFSDFINNKAFAYINRPSPIETIIEKIKEAEDWLEIQVSAALEKWIQKTKQEDAVLIVSKDGKKKYTASDILREIRNRTPFGIKFERDLNRLTIDLLARGKEKL